MSHTATGKLVCDMRADCAAEVTMIDDKGFAYCTHHGESRRSLWCRCRKLRPHELARLKRGETLAHY